MSKELIVASNPKKRRSAKQKAASRRNIKKAQAATRRGGRKRRRNVTTTRTTARRRSPTRAASAPRRRRSNPRGGFGLKGIVANQLMPALIGGAGAVGNDMLFNIVPLPVMLKIGPMRHLGKAATALAIGFVASFFAKKKTADTIAIGALTVVGYNVVRDLVSRFAPGIAMGEYLDPGLGYYGAGLDPGAGAGMGVYLDPNMGVVPGAGVEAGYQLTQGTPYLGGLGTTWPTQVEEETGEMWDYS